MNNEVAHRTVHITKTIPASVPAVFRSLSRASEKAKWSAPKGDEIRFLKSNFRRGGTEVFQCGPKGQMHFRGTLHFDDIIKNERIVYTETVSFKNEALATALITIQLTQQAQGTKIRMTIQVASYCGEKMLKGCESGYRTALSQLRVHHLPG